MQLTQYTDYSLRVLLYLSANPGRRSNISEIARSYGISKNHLMKVVQNLAAKGLVHSIRGRQGGLYHNEATDKITLGEVVRMCEPDFYLVECLDGVPGKCPIDSACYLKGVLSNAMKKFMEELDSYTIGEVSKNHVQLQPLLNIKPDVPKRSTALKSLPAGG
ncbi:RrF2 family transcriptional regulator [Leptospirillum ferrooxidans]|jgi:Rrf2 family nitric oxide-sensitive transcriptional repressor|uniref:Putative transcriptional regulator, BadM/Rrf2 family n=1 Tax=Leptospirillum ferrooxidans (strain C2-3) TaxID=1162668 RepID=I0IPY3_LEPFC|nr:Rrf2 family transcriptional regulator [Leptospirillum ferrooxidans]MDA8060164.1 Rrf2 family transcriptional regulator [Nitrospiraceae bacterium]BAM07332.1 putative transcriptional regulator, BadM/Rrf2 family [Leptospirillum ferrooxidans C2-3]